jgi:hypothetical protein
VTSMPLCSARSRDDGAVDHGDDLFLKCWTGSAKSDIVVITQRQRHFSSSLGRILETRSLCKQWFHESSHPCEYGSYDTPN